jgi:hypothetical protein
MSDAEMRQFVKAIELSGATVSEVYDAMRSAFAGTKVHFHVAMLVRAVMQDVWAARFATIDDYTRSQRGISEERAFELYEKAVTDAVAVLRKFGF